GGPRPSSRPASYAPFATVAPEALGALASAQPAPPAEPGQEALLPLSLEDFYAGYTFHGPRLRGIESIEQISSAGIVGWVKTSRPADLMNDPDRAHWTVD